MDLGRFRKLPVMGILRGIADEMIEPVVESVVAAGLETIEITMNTKGAVGLISKMQKIARGRLTIGAGTVLNLAELRQALDAGAGFIVSPVVVPEVVGYCVKNKIPVFPGAFSPQEIYQADGLGATMVKVFPAKFFGPGYFKEIKGPFADIELLACGGVNPENIGSFFSSGASAVAFGASVFRPEWLRSGEFSAITDSIKLLISSYKQLTN